MPCIDVIIPLYNSAKYVSDLVENLNMQTLKDFRVIFVDDGSADHTVDHLKSALEAASFPYTVAEQANGGAAAARNHGLRLAEADWITFMDSDDSLLPQFLEYLYTAATSQNAQLAFCNFRMVPESECVDAYDAGELNTAAISAAACMKRHYSSWISPACIMFSREIQTSNNLYFDEACRYCEDIPFITELIDAVGTVAKIDNELYLYRTHAGSLHRSPTLDKYLNGIASFQKTEQKLNQSASEAAEAFRSMGCARYYIATFRRLAAQMSYGEFLKLNKVVPFKNYGKQLPNLPVKHQVAGYLLLLSKRLFYYTMHLAFDD